MYNIDKSYRVFRTKAGAILDVVRIHYKVYFLKALTTYDFAPKIKFMFVLLCAQVSLFHKNIHTVKLFNFTSPKVFVDF